MMTPGWQDLRLFLHVLAAAVWVGGQFTVAGLVPAVRGLGGDATRTVARRFGQIAWPAFAVLVATGVWNAVAVDVAHQTGAWNATFDVKLGVVAAAGLSAFAHQRSTTKGGLALWGALSAVTALSALFLGVVLAG